MNIELELQRLDETVQWQDQNLNGLQIPSDDRTRVVAGLLHLALEHERSIGTLSDKDLFGSALALTRPLFESYIRALWFRYCATDSDLERFKRGKLNKDFGELIEDIENVKGYDVDVLSDLKSKYWSLFNDFTHGGISQVLGRFSEYEISPNYPDENKEGAILFAIIIGLLCAVEFANIVDDEAFARSVYERMVAIS